MVATHEMCRKLRWRIYGFNIFFLLWLSEISRMAGSPCAEWKFGVHAVSTTRHKLGWIALGFNESSASWKATIEPNTQNNPKRNQRKHGGGRRRRRGERKRITKKRKTRQNNKPSKQKPKLPTKNTIANQLLLKKIADAGRPCTNRQRVGHASCQELSTVDLDTVQTKKATTTTNKHQNTDKPQKSQ